MNDSSEVNLHFLDYWRIIKLRWAIILIVFLLVTVAAGITCYFLPREYLSKVVLEVKPDDTGMKIFSGDTGIGTSGNSRLSPTQFQIIQSKAVLYPVIENLKLTEAWASGDQQELPKEQAYYMLLRKMSSSREIRNTDMIEIAVYSTTPQEAADIANAISTSYQEKRRNDQLNLLEQGLGQMDEEVAKKRKAVQEALEQVQKIRAEEGIIDLNPETLEGAETTERNTVTQDEQQVNELKVRIAELKSQLEEIAKLKPEDLMSALSSLNIQDPTVSKVLPLYQDSVVEEARMLNSGLGENHPRVKALRAQKEVYAQQLSEQIVALRASLVTRMKVSEATLELLTTKLDESRDAYRESRKQTAGYVNAKAAYINAKRIVETAETRLETQRMQMGMSIYPAKVWEEAEPASYPARPNVLSYMSLAMGIGLIVGIGLAFFLEYLDTSVKTLEEVERLLAIPVLAVIPKGITYLIDNPGDSPDAEAYRILQTNLEFNRKDPAANTITLVSGGLGEGKSTTLNNLAYTYAKGGYNVLVVDADLRRASQHSLFGLKNTVGLVDLLTGKCELDQVIQKTKLPNLSLIPAGKPLDDSMGILNSRQMTEFIQNIKGSYDLVFFDSPPILGLSDASILAREVDITLMVVQYRRFPRSMLQRVKQAVLHVGGTLAGAVLNNVDTKRDANYQYYTQYYDYYTRPGTKNGKSTELAAAKSDRHVQTPGDY